MLIFLWVEIMSKLFKYQEITEKYGITIIMTISFIYLMITKEIQNVET